MVWLVLAQRLAAWIAESLIDHSQLHGADREQVYFETALLFFQVPAILLYTVGLGEQLH